MKKNRPRKEGTPVCITGFITFADIDNVQHNEIVVNALLHKLRRMSMAKIGIIGAMEIEVEILKQKLLSRSAHTFNGMEFVCGTLNEKETVIVRSGIGKVNAAVCAQLMADKFNVTHIINTGIAGAMARGLGVLDMVVSTDALYHDFDVTGFGYKPTVIPQMRDSVFAADRALLSAAEQAFAQLSGGIMQGHKLLAGRVASGDQFISSREAKSRIRTLCNPACVEMEGAAIAHTAYLNNIPFVIVRCISDMADDGEEASYKFNDKTAAEMSAALVQKIVEIL